jgi:mono/diheme cytochrome c family protein
MKVPILALASAISVLLAACGAKSPRGFRLPEGDIQRGQAAFVALQCHTCHTIEGVTLPPPGSKSAINVVLGGDVSRVKTYGELVTSVINPSHRISEKFDRALMKEGKLSPMPEFNHIMTVEQMIDIVAFLQPQYRLVADSTYQP